MLDLRSGVGDDLTHLRAALPDDDQLLRLVGDLFCRLTNRVAAKWRDLNRLAHEKSVAMSPASMPSGALWCTSTTSEFASGCRSGSGLTALPRTEITAASHLSPGLGAPPAQPLEEARLSGREDYGAPLRLEDNRVERGAS
jgi:hypothetical protein